MHCSDALQIVSSLPLDTLEPLVRTYFGAIPSGGVPSPVQQVHRLSFRHDACVE